MSSVTMQTHALDVPGATLAYDVHPPAAPGAHRPLLMVSRPMTAEGFTTLRGFFTDRTVITMDPRGCGRSTARESGPVTADVHAADIAAVIEAADDGPVDVFASSGGAINALALTAARPELLGTVVAHEPPLASVLPDRDAILAASRATYETYQRDGLGPGMARFIALIMHRGEVPAGFADGPAPDPAAFGLTTEDDGSRDDPMLGEGLEVLIDWRPDVEVLRATPVRLVVGAGAESAGEMAHRGAAGMAERLGLELTVFPSNHAGFLGGEFGQHGEPEAFAARLRELLDER
jgi:pimeloyl-ACP methyl ester carboxylesterase